MNDKPQGDIVKETGLTQSEVSITQKAIRTNSNLLRKNVYKVCRAMGIRSLTVEIELNEVE
jgi:predicted transcriptional regulator